MFSNIMSCKCTCNCNQCCTPNKNFYLQVKNECPIFINIILYYTIHGNRITKPYPVFGPGKTQRVSFPADATNLDFDINNCYFVPPVLICNPSIPDHKSSCFKVVKDHAGNFQCVPIAC